MNIESIPNTLEAGSTPQTITIQPGETPEQVYARLYGTQRTQQVETPTSVVTPVTIASSAPSDREAELTTTLSLLTQEIALLKDRVNSPQSAPVIVPTAVKNEWVEKIRQGDYDGAQQSLANAIQAQLQPQLERV